MNRFFINRKALYASAVIFLAPLLASTAMASSSTESIVCRLITIERTDSSRSQYSELILQRTSRNEILTTFTGSFKGLSAKIEFSGDSVVDAAIADSDKTTDKQPLGSPEAVFKGSSQVQGGLTFNLNGSTNKYETVAIHCMNNKRP